MAFLFSKQLSILMIGLCLPGITLAQTYLDSLKVSLDSLAQHSSLPGFSVAVVKPAGEVFIYSAGYACLEPQKKFEADARINLGSVSKTVVGLALAKAIEEGHLSLDSPIEEFLDFPVSNPWFKDQPILVRHLANHTSTIRDSKHYGKTYIPQEKVPSPAEVHPGFQQFIQSHEALSMPAFLARILSPKGAWYRKKNFHKRAPGQEADYANLNAALAALVIEKASGQSFKAFTQAYIFDPLKMGDTSWEIVPDQADHYVSGYFPAGAMVPPYQLITYADGGLISTAPDLSKLLAEMMCAYQGKSTYLPPTYARMLLPGDQDEDRMFWGMGEKSRLIGHGGSDPGVQTGFRFHADSLLGRVVLCNMNAEDQEALWQKYREIHRILDRYEKRLP